MRREATAIVLAGGRSRRMGRDKAFLPWGQTTLIEHLIERLHDVTDEVIVAVNPALSRKGGVKDAPRFRSLNVRVVEDLVPDAHALGGLYTGLRAASHELCFVCGCDMPWLDPAVIRWLIREADGYDMVVPRTSDGLQPLHAIYRVSVRSVIEEQLRRGALALADLVGRVRAKIVGAEALRRLDPQGFSFLNMNTPDEYMTALNDSHHGRLFRRCPS